MRKTIFFDLEVYSYQIDLLGHVNNAIYIQWIEIGRTKLLEVVGLPTPEIVKQGFAPVLVHTSITYKSPIFFRRSRICQCLGLPTEECLCHRTIPIPQPRKNPGSRGTAKGIIS